MRNGLKSAMVVLAFAVLPALAVAQHGITARFLGTVDSSADSSGAAAAGPELAHPLGITATAPAPPVISFNAAAVGISAGSAQTLTASFTVSGYSGSYTPAATAHYGHDYSLGAVYCTPSGSSETCNVPVTFQPTLPGARADAIFLTDGVGGARLATVLLGGVGQGPLALVQPGYVVTTFPNSKGTGDYYYNAAVDENGTIYALTNNIAGTTGVAQIDKNGTLTWLPVAAGNHSSGQIAIDGAGVLYFNIYGYGSYLDTYDTVTGAQGTLSMDPPGYTPCTNAGTPGSYFWYFSGAAVDAQGNVYANETLCQVVIERKTDGTFAWFPLNPKMTQLWDDAVDTSGNIYASGYSINKIVPGGAQTQVNPNAGVEGLDVDAAGTLYQSRYYFNDNVQGAVTSVQGVAMLPASDYTTPIGGLYTNAGGYLGQALASDGTVYVGNYTQVDKYDRSQGSLDFTTINILPVGTTSSVLNTGLYNGGNEPLTISAIASPDAGFNAVASASNGCAAPMTLAPGTACSLDVTTTLTHGGVNTGTIVFTTNSLNGSSSTTSVALKAIASGPWISSSPAALDFGNVTPGSTSAAQNVTLTDNGYDLGGPPYFSTATVPAGFAVNTSSCSGLASSGAKTSCTVPVTFSPTTTTAYSGAVSIPFTSTSFSGAKTVTFTVAGNGGASGISIAPTVITFGSLGAGLTSPANQVTVTNTGSAPLHISAIALTGSNPGQFQLPVGGSCSTSTPVAAGGSCTVLVTFAPTVAASASASITFTDDAPSGTQSVSMTGTGTVVDLISVTPNPVDWGDVPLLTTLTRTVTFTNNNGFPVSITGTPSTSGATRFSEMTTTCGATVAASASCTVLVAFNGTAVGTVNDTLTFNDTSSTGPHTVALKANVVPPTVTLTPSPLDFGDVGIGFTSPTLKVTLSNTGPGDLRMTGITLSGNPAFTNAGGTTCISGTPIPVGSGCVFFFVFNPTVVGTATGTLTIAEYGGAAPLTLPLTGNGVSPAITIAPSPLDFGNVGAGSASPIKYVTVTNNGPGALSFKNIGVGGGAAFTMGGGTCAVGTPVAVGSSCTVGITFMPNVAGAFSGTLALADDAVGSPQSVAITGTGVAPTFTLTPVTGTTPADFDLGSIGLGSTGAVKTLTLTNTSSVDGAISLSHTAAFGNSGSIALTNNTCGATLAAGASCSLSFQFTASATIAGSEESDYKFTTNGTPNLLPFMVTATAVGPTLTVAPSSLDFGSVPVGTISASQMVTLTNTSTIPAHFGVTTISNGTIYGITDTCAGTTLAAGASCTTTVNFQPALAGAITATIAYNNDAANSPQVVNLTGTGTVVPNDFTIAAAPGARTIGGGGAATYTITVTPNSQGYPRAIDFAVTGLPAGATATFSPASVIPNNAPATLTMTVQTIALARNETPDNGLRLAGFGGGLLSLASVLLAALLGRARRRMHGFFLVALAFFALAAATALMGCSNPKLAPVTSTLTITGTHASTVHTTTVQLTVQ